MGPRRPTGPQPRGIPRNKSKFLPLVGLLVTLSPPQYAISAICAATYYNMAGVQVGLLKKLLKESVTVLDSNRQK